jgi:hypothetical protein
MATPETARNASTNGKPARKPRTTKPLTARTAALKIVDLLERLTAEDRTKAQTMVRALMASEHAPS